MANQPDVAVIHQGFRAIAAEFEKFPNVPALSNGNAILQSIAELSTKVDQNNRALNQRLDGIDRRLDGIDQRFDGIDQRLDTLTTRITAK